MLPCNRRIEQFYIALWCCLQSAQRGTGQLLILHLYWDKFHLAQTVLLSSSLCSSIWWCWWCRVAFAGQFMIYGHEYNKRAPNWVDLVWRHRQTTVILCYVTQATVSWQLQRPEMNFSEVRCPRKRPVLGCEPLTSTHCACMLGPFGMNEWMNEWMNV